MAAKRTRKLLVWALCLHLSMVFGQTTFQKTFGGPGNEVATWVTEASNGFLLAGHVISATGNQDALLIRFNPNGNIIWQKRFGAAQADLFNGVVSTPDGGFLAVGETKSYGAGNSDLFLVKVDEAGGMVWSRTLGDATHYEVAKSIIAVPGGGFIVSGEVGKDGDLTTKAIMLRLDPNGNTLWSHLYGTGTSNTLLSNYLDGNVIYASGSTDAEGVFARIDLATGAVLSTLGYTGAGIDALHYQQPTQDGNLILSDHTLTSPNGTNVKLWVQKINKTNGQILWSKVYSRVYDNIRGRIEKVNDGGFLLVPYDHNNTAQADALLAKIDANGNLLWSYNYGGSASDRLMKAIQMSDGGFVAVGDTRSNNPNGNNDLLIIRTDANGHIEGHCPQVAGIQSNNFSTDNLNAQLNKSPWLQAVPQNSNPLSINLNGIEFNPQPAPVMVQNIPLCPNKSYAVNGIEYFAPKLIADTIRHFGGCDTIFHYNLTLNAYNTGTRIVGLCDGESYAIDGFSYTAPNTVLDTVKGQNGECDTIFNYILKSWAQPTATQTLEFCPGASVMLGGQMYTQPGTVQINLPATNGGCDTVVTYHLVLRPQPTRSATIAFCQGESVMIGGQIYHQAGTVTSIIPATSGGCDTLLTYTLVERPLPTRSATIAFCTGESVVIGGTSFMQSGVVQSTIPATSGGCDTLVTYTLIERPLPTRSATIVFCPGESVVIGGTSYTQSGVVESTIPAVTGGCDTLVTYTLEYRPQPTRTEKRSFCPGESLILGGQTYSQPTTVVLNVPSSNGGCDTLVTYTLELQPQAIRTETRSLCPGTSITLAGQTYAQSGTVMVNLPSTNGGCDTVVTYVIEMQAQPARAETRSFCPGETIVIAGQSYHQAGTVIANLPSANGGCDTIVTYTLQSLTPAPSNIAIQCPNDLTITVNSGGRPLEAIYPDPVAASDCICPGLQLTRTYGPASGSLFSVGTTQICYTAKDNCGQEKPCCFSVNIREETPCDVKVNGCMKYELLNVTADASKNLTYSIRVTNNCANKLIYTAIQIPDGISTLEPSNNSTYKSPQDRYYLVRSPNYSPIYSVRFKSTVDSIANGQSDIFEYTLPAQTEVRFIDISTRLAGSAVFNEAHLNTFNCAVGVSANNLSTKPRDAETVEAQNSLLLFPNPTTGVLFADLSDWQGQKLQIQVTNTQGQVLHTMKLTADEDLLRVDLPQGINSGVYFMEVLAENGKKEAMRFVLKR